VAYDVGGHRSSLANLEIGQQPADRERVHTGFEQVAAGEHGAHAGMRASGRRIDAAHARVRVRAAHECGVRGAGNPHIVGVEPAAGDEARILDALDAGAEEATAGRNGRRHGSGRSRSGQSAAGTVGGEGGCCTAGAPHAGVWIGSPTPLSAILRAAYCTARTTLW
jgi:hypothetical protein